MAEQVDISKAISDGFTIFFKEWQMLLSIYAVLFIPLFLLVYIIALTAPLLSPVIMILAAVAGIIFQISIISIVKKRWKDKKSLSFSKVMKDVAKYFVPMLGTGLLIFLILLPFLILIAAIGFGGYFLLEPSGFFENYINIILSIGLISIIGIILIIIPSIYLMFSTYLVVVKDMFYMKAIKESYQMVKGRWWYMFARVLLIQLISMGLSMIVGIGLSSIYLITGPSMGIQIIDTFIRQIVTLPMGVAMVVFFMQIVTWKKYKKKART